MSMPDRRRPAPGSRAGGVHVRRAVLTATLLLVLRSPVRAEMGMPDAGLPTARATGVQGAQPHWPAASTGPALGRPLTRDQQATLAPTIFPDGQGLPPGRGLASDGARLYQQQCAACHGRQAQGATAPELIGGDGPLSSPDADKTLATYWPYATTLFDTLRRSMPPAAPGHLSADELYALCAWLLSQNRLWSAEQPLDAAGLAGIRMPNRDGFVPADAP